MRRRRARRRPTRVAELLLVPMIDIFTVLVTFLLMTAVFSRITIIELDLPSAASAGAPAPPFRLEVIVRQEGIELSDGDALIAAIPNVNGEYDLETLSELALALKRDYPEANDASVLLEPEIAYDHLIRVMDAIRSVEEPADAEPRDAGREASVAQPQLAKATGSRLARVALFTDIAVGDAP
jgi:biopolymer transport protein ExbD